MGERDERPAVFCPWCLWCPGCNWAGEWIKEGAGDAPPPCPRCGGTVIHGVYVGVPPAQATAMPGK